MFDEKDFIPILYCFLALLGTTSQKIFIYQSLSSSKNLKKIKTTPLLLKLGKWSNRHTIYEFWDFMLGCRFNRKGKSMLFEN